MFSKHDILGGRKHWGFAKTDNTSEQTWMKKELLHALNIKRKIWNFLKLYDATPSGVEYIEWLWAYQLSCKEGGNIWEFYQEGGFPNTNYRWYPCRVVHCEKWQDFSSSETNIFRPYFEKTSHDVTVQLGDSAFFECHIFNLHNQTVYINYIKFRKIQPEITRTIWAKVFINKHSTKKYWTRNYYQKISSKIFVKKYSTTKKYQELFHILHHWSPVQVKFAGVLDPQIGWLSSLHWRREIHQWQKIWAHLHQVGQRFRQLWRGHILEPLQYIVGRRG